MTLLPYLVRVGFFLSQIIILPKFVLDDLHFFTNVLLVKSEDMSKLTNSSSSPTVVSLIVSVKCLEFKMWELVFPVRGEMMKALIVLEKLVGG